MKLNRNYITPFITLVFLAVALTGVLMLFHLFDGYTEVVHEILGLLFVVLSVFHITLNWKALKIHLKKHAFIPTALVVVAISILLIIQQHNNPKFDTILFEEIIKAPIGDLIKVFQIDSTEAAKKLKANGIAFEEGVTMQEIWIKNNVHPKEVFDLIME
jgi:hypothetical protein